MEKKNIVVLMAVLAITATTLFFGGCAGGGKESTSSTSSEEKIINDDDRLKAIVDPFILAVLDSMGVDAEIMRSHVEAHKSQEDIHWIVITYSIQSKKEGELGCVMLATPIRDGVIFKLEVANEDQYDMKCYHIGDVEGKAFYEKKLKRFKDIANNYGAGGRMMTM